MKRSVRRPGRLVVIFMACAALIASACSSSGPATSTPSLDPLTTATAAAGIAGVPGQVEAKGQVVIDNPNKVLPILPARDYYQSIPRAHCGPGSVPETGFQGEVPLAARQAGFKGYSCNLQLVGQSQGQGASWQNAWYGKCDYYDQALPGDASSPNPTGGTLKHPGAVVIDASDPAHPKPTAYLNTPGLDHPWESLKVNQKRGLLAGQLSAGASLDVYDVSKDCTRPTLDASVPLPNFGHEGEWSPDGKTYWAESIGATGEYHPIDMTDPKHPKEILSWGGIGHRTHGLNISADGMTGYFSITGHFGAPGSSQPVVTNNVADNGFAIADISDIQLRKPNPKIHVISTVTFLDGSIAQNMIPITIGGKPYLVFFDELGAEGLGSPPNWKKACADGLPPFGVARIFDISDPKKPTLVSRLTLQTDDPANCQTAVNDVIAGGQTIFSSDSHYCSVDTQTNTTALACGYFNSGIRVFDIRDPATPKEIAYYVPPGHNGEQKKLAGSEHAQTEAGAKLSNGLSADWCSSQSRFYHAPDGQWYLWAQCQDSGFLDLKFTNNVYPLK